jgi:glycosyltransferase involved in cell wall biosynthesis
MSEKVSVVMAAYNGERYIEESVRSILGQTLENFEFIIVDDGSTDSTFNKLQQIGDPRLRIIRQSNQGQTSALIAGIQHAKGDLIARLDDDDYSLPNRLMSQLKFMEAHPKVSLCGSRFQELHRGRLVAQRVPFVQTNTEIKRIMSFYNPFAHSSVMFRHDAYFKVGGYSKKYTISMDYDLWLRLMDVGEVCNIDEAFTVIRLHNNSVSMKQERLKILEGIEIRTRAYRKFRGNIFLVGFYFFKSIMGLILPRWMKVSF